MLKADRYLGLAPPRLVPLLHDGYRHCNDLDWIHQTALTNTMSNHANDAPGASSTCSVLGYILNHICFIILFMFISEINMNTSTYFVITGSLSYVMKWLIIFGIKIYLNVPIFLTIQKPDRVNRLSVASFAATTKPPPFYGSNYKRWRERLILWLMAM